MFEAGDAVFAGDDAGGFDEALLFFAGYGGVVFFPGGVDLLADLGRGGGEGEDGSVGSGLEGWKEIVGGAGEDLEADFLFAHGLDDGGRDHGWGSGACEEVGGDEVRRHSHFGFGEHHAAGEGGEDGGDEDAALWGVARGGDESGDAFEGAGGILDGDDVGVLGELGDDFEGELGVGEFGDAVEDDGERGAVGEGAVVGDHATGGGG